MLIPVTIFSGDRHGKVRFINSDFIIEMYVQQGVWNGITENYTWIERTHGESRKVRETPEQIVELIRRAGI